jgi:FkbM family methyltransferase
MPAAIRARVRTASINGPLYARKIGLRGMFTFAVVPRIVALLGRLLRKPFGGRYLPVVLRRRPGIVWMRYDTSDYDVLRQIFVIEEFKTIGVELDAPKYIVDCGANAGYAALYFLQRYPTSFVTAIEPESGNVRLCEKNLQPYADRTAIVEAGVWSSDVGLIVEKGIYADGRDWATRVRAAAADEVPQVQGVHLGTILNASGFDVIDLLKVDIENSERTVFGSNVDDWLPRVRNIVIELHDDECRQTFFAALEGYRYDLVRQGNLTICKGLQRATAG